MPIIDAFPCHDGKMDCENRDLNFNPLLNYSEE